VATFVLDEQKSIAGLFSFYKNREREEENSFYHSPLSLVEFDVSPEYYVMFNKPFRVRITDKDHDSSKGSQRYLLVRRITDNGAVVIDEKGVEQRVLRNYILSHWDRTVSFAYPVNYNYVILKKGMILPDVLKVQQIFSKIGYLIEPTGIYDNLTFHEVMKFQEDFGLIADGLIGPQTRALLYLMEK